MLSRGNVFSQYRSRNISLLFIGNVFESFIWKCHWYCLRWNKQTTSSNNNKNGAFSSKVRSCAILYNIQLRIILHLITFFNHHDKMALTQTNTHKNTQKHVEHKDAMDIEKYNKPPTLVLNHKWKRLNVYILQARATDHWLVKRGAFWQCISTTLSQLKSFWKGTILSLSCRVWPTFRFIFIQATKNR